MEKKANPRRFRAIRAAALVLAALILAAGLEWVMQRTLPPRKSALVQKVQMKALEVA